MTNTIQYRSGQYKIDQSFIEKCDRELDVILENAVNRLCLNSDGVKVMGLTGPTCSGKTTAAKKLLHHFHENGKKVITVSLDDFFKDLFSRKELANVKVEDLDFDSPDTLDMELLSQFVDGIFENGRAEKPIFDFVKGERSRWEEIVCGEDDVLLFEGIQVLYPAVLSIIEEHGGRIMCVRPESGIEIGGKRFEPDFIRLCRRLVRDTNFRGASPDFTLSLWDSVRRNEEENIFPHIHRCTVGVDTTLAYELNILAPYLRRILQSVEWGSKHHKQSLEILGLLEEVVGIESFVISEDSLYKEFV
jgi:uridine kinase